MVDAQRENVVDRRAFRERLERLESRPHELGFSSLRAVQELVSRGPPSPGGFHTIRTRLHILRCGQGEETGVEPNREELRSHPPRNFGNCPRVRRRKVRFAGEPARRRHQPHRRHHQPGLLRELAQCARTRGFVLAAEPRCRQRSVLLLHHTPRKHHEVRKEAAVCRPKQDQEFEPVGKGTDDDDRCGGPRLASRRSRRRIHAAMMTTSESETPLADRLRRRIAAEGPITFAEFVEAALYDPKDGFYSHAAVGENAHFVTSPHISAAFGSLVARQIEEFWELLDRPAPFTVVEGGAGTGVLARQVLDALAQPVRGVTRYVAVERSVAAREAARETGIDVAATLDEVGRGPVGCVIANELLDNLPFHRVKATADGIVELFVSLDGDRFVLKEGPPSSNHVSQLAPPLRVGEEGVVNLEALRFLDAATALFDRSYIWVVDYGWPSMEHGAMVHGYRDHRLQEDVLSDPGSRDITAGVYFDPLVRHARSRGINVWAPVTQREALMALGYEEWEHAALTEQGRLLSAGRGLEAIRTFSERGRARMLVDPAGLGGFHVVCFGVRTERPPRSLSGTA